MKIHREGKKIILVSLLILGALTALLMWLCYPFYWLMIPLLILAVLTALVIVRFFRAPKRATPFDENNITSPADGKIVAIERIQVSEYLHEDRIQVSVFMSPLDVHVNYFPISGTTEYMQYHPGKHLVAFHPKSSTENERTTVVVKNNNGSVLFRQIAGAVARRIVCYAKKGKIATQGTEFGFIKFGSRVDVFLPITAKIKVELEQKVTGAETILATFS